jgi:hypothetical protein
MSNSNINKYGFDDMKLKMKEVNHGWTQMHTDKRRYGVFGSWTGGRANSDRIPLLRVREKTGDA